MWRWIGIVGLAGCDRPEVQHVGRRESSSVTSTGCPDGFYSGPVSLARADVTCGGDVLALLGETVGWANGGFLFIQETADDPEEQRAEEHAVLDTTFDMCGGWCTLEQSLDAGVAEPVVDESTAFACDDDGGRTYAVGVHDIEGTFVDCVAWGHDPQGLVDGVAGVPTRTPSHDLGRCRVLDEG